MTDGRESTASPAQGRQRTGEDGSSETEFMKLLGLRLREFGEYASYFLSAKRDQIKLSTRTLILVTALVCLEIVVLAGIMIIGAWFFVQGLAGLLGDLFDKAWIGNLLAGGLVLCGTALMTWIGVNYYQNKKKRETIDRYEARQRQQQSDYGHSVDTRSETPE